MALAWLLNLGFAASDAAAPPEPEPEVRTFTGGWLRDAYRAESDEERRKRIRAAREVLGIVEPVREIAAEQLPDEDIDAPAGESVEALQARLAVVLEALDRQRAVRLKRRKAAAVLLLTV